MMKDPKILSELEQISPLLASLHDKKDVFSVPEGYFNSLTENIREFVITASIRDIQSKEQSVQQVPEGYFDTLSSSILKKVKATVSVSDSDGVAAFWADDAAKKNVFTVPTGYFENLPEEILSKVRQESGAKVVPMYRKPMFKYLVAASVAALLFVAVFFTSGDLGQKSGFAVINKHNVPIAAALEFKSEKAFEEGIASLSEDQIIAYLENHGSILDNDQLVNGLSLASMPEPLDYLIDDKALDNYLDEIIR